MGWGDAFSSVFDSASQMAKAAAQHVANTSASAYNYISDKAHQVVAAADRVYDSARSTRQEALASGGKFVSTAGRSAYSISKKSSSIAASSYNKASSVFEKVKPELTVKMCQGFNSFLGIPQNKIFDNANKSTSFVLEVGKLLETAKILDNLGFNAKEISTKLFDAINNEKISNAFVGSKNYSPLLRKFETIGKVSSAIDIIFTASEIYNLLCEKKYNQIPSKIYETFMNNAIPWAGLINDFQDILEIPFPGIKTTNNVYFEIFRAMNPTGLGKVGIDGMVFTLESMANVVQGKSAIDDNKLSELVDRINEGPARIFAQIGSDAGAAIYDFSQMNSNDWKIFSNYMASQALKTVTFSN